VPSLQPANPARQRLGYVRPHRTGEPMTPNSRDELLGQKGGEGRAIADASREEWRPAPGYEGLYEVSSLGRVRNINGRVLAQHLDGRGYPQLGLCRDAVKLTQKPHRLVCRAFHGAPGEGQEVAHLDGNPLNASADNLAWVSRSENNRHKELHGTHQAGERHPRAKLTADGVAEIRASSQSSKHLAGAFGVNERTIRKIRKGERWSA
jgi:hypothetical protein